MGRKRSHRKRPYGIWLRNAAGGWNVGVLGEKPPDTIRVYTRDGSYTEQQLIEYVGTRKYNGRVYTLYTTRNQAHPFRRQFEHYVQANRLGWLAAVAPPF